MITVLSVSSTPAGDVDVVPITLTIGAGIGEVVAYLPALLEELEHRVNR